MSGHLSLRNAILNPSYRSRPVEVGQFSSCRHGEMMLDSSRIRSFKAKSVIAVHTRTTPEKFEKFFSHLADATNPGSNRENCAVFGNLVSFYACHL